MRLPLRQYWNLLSKYMLPQRSQLMLLGLLLVAGLGLRLAGPQLVGSFIDAATENQPLSILLAIAAAFCAISLVDQANLVATSYLGANIGWIATNSLREELTEHSLKLDMAFHHRHTPGEMIERVDGDAQELSSFFSQFAVQLLSNLLLLTGVLVVLLLEDWRIGLAFLLFSFAALIVFNRIRDSVSHYWDTAREASANLYGFVEERLGGINDIRANGANAYIHRRFMEAIRHLFHRNRVAIAMGVIVGNGAEIILSLGAIAALSIAVSLFLSGAVSIGTIYIVTMYAVLINRPLQEIISQIEDLQRATASISRVEELVRIKPTISSGSGKAIGAGALAVQFENVSFRYDSIDSAMPYTNEPIEAATDMVPGEPDVLEHRRTDTILQNISFQLVPGEVLGLIGHTGSGKTTIIRLLLRLYDPIAGKVKLNHVDLRDAQLDEMHSRIGVVTQNVHLFNAALRDTLTLFDRSIPDDKIVAALHELGLHEWFAALPQGLDTVLATEGAGLSAGQAQLLSVVRVFLKDPGLLILDEASSRLDPITERVLERAFDRLIKGRTTVIIAHRLSTVKRADTIMLLDQGAVKEYGPREQLALDPSSTFHRLLKLGMTDELLTFATAKDVEQGSHT